MKTISAIVLACAALCPHANAAPQSGASELSDASALVGGGSAMLVGGSLSILAGAGLAVVASVTVVGESVVIVLEGASAAASATIRMSGQALRGVSVVAGTAVSVVAIATGTVLITAGKVIAFIPNEMGKALLHQSRRNSWE